MGLLGAAAAPPPPRRRRRQELQRAPLLGTQAWKAGGARPPSSHSATSPGPTPGSGHRQGPVGGQPQPPPSKGLPGACRGCRREPPTCPPTSFPISPSHMEPQGSPHPLLLLSPVPLVSAARIQPSFQGGSSMVSPRTRDTTPTPHAEGLQAALPACSLQGLEGPPVSSPTHGQWRVNEPRPQERCSVPAAA